MCSRGTTCRACVFRNEENQHEQSTLSGLEHAHGGLRAPPALTNKANEGFYYGFFQNRFGEQWVFIYDLKEKVGELRGGDIGWDKAVPVRDGIADVVLGKAELAWLFACWTAATGIG